MYECGTTKGRKTRARESECQCLLCVLGVRGHHLQFSQNALDMIIQVGDQGLDDPLHDGGHSRSTPSKDLTSNGALLKGGRKSLKLLVLSHGALGQVTDTDVHRNELLPVVVSHTYIFGQAVHKRVKN